jgi:hypothetical protein
MWRQYATGDRVGSGGRKNFSGAGSAWPGLAQELTGFGVLAYIYRINAVQMQTQIDLRELLALGIADRLELAMLLLASVQRETAHADADQELPASELETIIQRMRNAMPFKAEDRKIEIAKFAGKLQRGFDGVSYQQSIRDAWQ